MQIFSTAAIEPCPRCNGQPQIVRNGQYQARCACGACGPAVQSKIEAARRWRKVVYYMREHQACVGEMLQLVSHGDRSRR